MKKDIVGSVFYIDVFRYREAIAAAIDFDIFEITRLSREKKNFQTLLFTRKFEINFKNQAITATLCQRRNIRTASNAHRKAVASAGTEVRKIRVLELSN